MKHNIYIPYLLSTHTFHHISIQGYFHHIIVERMHHEGHGIKAFVLGCGGTLVQSFNNPERGKWPVLRHQAVKKTKWFKALCFQAIAMKLKDCDEWLHDEGYLIYQYKWYSCFSLAFSLLRFECLSIATNSFRIHPDSPSILCYK